jgi:ParB/RepB/Spo0J family partition protein
MNAPDQITTLLIEQLIPSPTNPRKRFDAAKLQELADSIKAHGVLQPILVREQHFEEGKPRRAEIISGERRYRAAKLAGIDMVPVMIRNLTDTEVLHAQVIENLQRDDLHELEEAEGYERLLQEKDRNGQPYTAETIAAEIGKSRAYVYARLKLLDLCQEAREACYAGEIDASTALLIARIPVHKLQVEALKEVTRKVDTDYATNQCKGDKALSYRKAREILQDRYMLDLADAPFDIKDAALCPKAGSCTDCTKRTGNQPELFDDVASKDVCTDPVCHAMKKTAHVLALQKAAEEKGNKLLLGKDAKKLIPNYMKTPEEHLKDHGYVPLDAKVPGDEQNRTFGQILKEAKLLTPAKDTGKAAVPKTIVEHPHRANTMIETVSIEQATKALREAGFEITMKAQADTRQKEDDKRAKEREKEKQELAIENTFRSRLFDTLHAQIEADMLDPNSGTFPKLYKRMAKELMDTFGPSGEDMQILVQKYTTPVKQEGSAETDWEATFEQFENELPNFTPAQHLMLIVELTLIVNELFANQWSGEAKTMRALAEDLGIDADGIHKEVADEVKAEQKAKAAAEKKAATKKEAKAEQATTPASTPEQPKARPKASWPFPTPGDQTK